MMPIVRPSFSLMLAANDTSEPKPRLFIFSADNGSHCVPSKNNAFANSPFSSFGSSSTFERPPLMLLPPRRGRPAKGSSAAEASVGTKDNPLSEEESGEGQESELHGAFHHQRRVATIVSRNFASFRSLLQSHDLLPKSSTRSPK